MKSILYLLLILLPISLFADKKTSKKKQVLNVFTSWGYNRAFYTKSAIHFKGDEYHFTLKKTIAKDRQTPISASHYLNISNLTIPQYNFSVGVQLPKNITVTIGQDHMKYVVEQYSIATLDGYTHLHDEFEGDYHNQEIVLTPDFLQFEHTDGLNYVHATVNKQKRILTSKNKNQHLQVMLGIHGGLLIPRSNVTLMHFERNDKFHLAGYGVGVNMGICATFLKYCFFRLDHKTGFINMPNILTRGIQYKDRAQQHFGFIEFFYSFGVQYPL
ncbi:MAG: hypothetical protein IPL09_05685 [Bacteroidetes bacterium]|jgi:hypothetical protein|nr:hypothetical protein [Bacteroidota bacterium]HMT34512.1 hypothetical protein [Chitinophagaceae bacterium]MBK6820529.1 hypothetical protein [Bacteroidota bacterium]MBK7040958.1 hypothetical protein [Bacteroidota bacterium]MBK7587885.1 hypothetical protein [Bacteroidota bacterium]